MDEHVIETTEGAVRGAEKDGVVSWKGIPFARPPVGPFRFRRPEPHGRWDGVRDATAFGPSAPQNPSPAMALLGAEQLVTDEDCLTLNVWSPGADGSGRPVMVWIHGGAFQIGSGSQHWYDGHRLSARGDVVVVTINYRLGALGFLYLDHLDEHAADAGSGNLGILDQIRALEWVRDNISRFGGDPSQVTIFGESAGAMSVATLLGTPAARGLFARAIAQSGAAAHVRTTEEAAGLTRLFMEVAGASSVDDLRRLSAGEMMAAQDRTVRRPEVLAGAISGQLPFQPVVDKVVLETEPLDVVAGGGASGVALLIGTTQEEMRLFAAMDPAFNDLDEARLLGRVGKLVGKLAAAELVSRYRDARAARGQPTEPSELWQAIATDHVFRIPALELARAQGAYAPVWMYRFTWPSPLLDGRLGSCHALDLPFVWGAVSDPPTDAFVGDGPEARELAGAMQDAWLAFAREGEPAAASLPHWPRFDDDARPHMLLGAERRVVENPEAAEMYAWAALRATPTSREPAPPSRRSSRAPVPRG